MTVHATAISDLDAFALGEAFRTRRLSPVEAAKDALDRAEASQSTVNAFALIDRERTLAWARESEARWANGAPLGPFDGVGVTIKDNMAVAGWPSIKGSKVAPRDPMAFDAPVTARCKEAGLVVLGTTTMPEFGWTATTETLTGQTHNPWHLDYSSGGSSGGSAAWVASGVVPIAHGNDGGGSIRIPAAACGLVGLKPTRGRLRLTDGGEAMPVRVVTDSVLARSTDLSLYVTGSSCLSDRWPFENANRRG